MDEGFKVGDTVYLKSGSPKLTVIRIGNENVDVAWVTEGGATVKQHNFPVACLTKTEPRRTA